MPLTVKDALQNEDFYKLPVTEQRKWLGSKDTDFAQLPEKEQNKFIGRNHLRYMQSPGYKQPEAAKPSPGGGADDPTAYPGWAFASGAIDEAKGWVKGALSSATHLGEMGIDPEGDPNTPLGRDFNKVRQDQKALTEAVRTPSNERQRSAMAREQFAEYFIPGVDEVVPELKAGKGLLGAARRVATSAGRGAVQAGVVGTAQTGSLKEGAKQAAFGAVANPILSEASRAMSPILKKSAQHLYERFILPGGGKDINKETARDAAEEMIKQGHLEWSQGSFIRHVDEGLQKADQEIKAIEDNILNSQGYSPTGRYNINVTAHPVTHTGPVINVEPITPPGTALTRTTKEVGFPERAVGPHIPEETHTTEGWRYGVNIDQQTRRGMIDAKPVIKQLRADLARRVVNGKVIEGFGPMVARIQRTMVDIRRNMTPSGYIDAKKAILFRRSWDELVNWQKAEGVKSIPGAQEAYKSAANALRHEIGEQIDGMREANAKYHFYGELNDVLKNVERRGIGRRAVGLISAIGATSLVGGELAQSKAPEEVAALLILGYLAKEAATSGAVMTTSAVAMDRAAKLIAKKQFAAAVNSLAAASSRVTRSKKEEKPDPNDTTAQERERVLAQ